jgi:hypothetical protein
MGQEIGVNARAKAGGKQELRACAAGGVQAGHVRAVVERPPALRGGDQGGAETQGSLPYADRAVTGAAGRSSRMYEERGTGRCSEAAG